MCWWAVKKQLTHSHSSWCPTNSVQLGLWTAANNVEHHLMLARWTLVNYCKATLFTAVCAMTLASPEGSNSLVMTDIMVLSRLLDCRIIHLGRICHPNDFQSSCHWLVMTNGQVSDQWGLHVLVDNCMQDETHGCVAAILHAELSSQSFHSLQLYTCVLEAWC